MERTFVGNFHLMASRDNDLKPKGEREYFDRPFMTLRGSGTGFVPVISKPHIAMSVSTRGYFSPRVSMNTPNFVTTSQPNMNDTVNSI